MTGTSGIQRALRFSQYLPEFGWEPIVLTARPCAYERTSDDQVADIPSHIHVERAFALDAARHLSVFGAYPRLLADPDRWMSWWLGGVPSGMRLAARNARRRRPHYAASGTHSADVRGSRSAEAVDGLGAWRRGPRWYTMAR